jgi:hypothetical protein
LQEEIAELQAEVKIQQLQAKQERLPNSQQN